MKSITSFSLMAFSMNSRISALVMSASGWGCGLDRESVDRTTDVACEHVVDEPVLLDAREPLEAVRSHLGPEVVTASSEVLDRDQRAREGGLDALLQLVWSGHAWRVA